MIKTSFCSPALKIFIIGILLKLICHGQVMSQVSVNGPVCIIPGLPYQYIIKGVWKDSSNLQVCVTGGILDNGTHCSSAGSILNNMVITWKDTTQHFIELRSTEAILKFPMQSTNELKGGELHANDKVLKFDTSKKEYVFRCGPPNGGTCNPEYKYQWQESVNGINWSNITGATEENLNFRDRVTVNTYFRRMVQETVSGLIAYSDRGLLSMQL